MTVYDPLIQMMYGIVLNILHLNTGYFSGGRGMETLSGSVFRTVRGRPSSADTEKLSVTRDLPP